MGQSHIESVVKATTLEGAWKARCALGTEARFLAGGIDLALFTPPSVKVLIDLVPLELSYVRGGESGIEVGATTTMTDVIESPQIASYAGGFVQEVLRQVASPLQRNLATLGGTLARAHPWSDVIPALLVLDAEVMIFDGEERILPLAEFYEERQRSEQALIVEVRLPRLPEGGRGAFIGFTRTGFDVALLNVACFGAIEDVRWMNARIAIGGTPGLATRLRDVEAQLVGHAAAPEEITAASGSAAAAIDARDDRRASAEFRRTLARELVARCLLRIAELPEGGAH